MGKKPIFRFFFDFLENCSYDSNEIFHSQFLHHNMVLCVQFQWIRMIGIGATQEEKDLSRFLYRIYGSGNAIAL